ncbi:radical SAM protein [Parablautia muri]|uniref:Radical SAM protein n=1 Tax=Parablautia muri TaxID=2320879 RepID=A0A9X5BCR7_9FIRM|nr:radical SAM protein [Parablautia muri]NBJ91228.1 radical SAM protein [Parablautia muri]
MAVKWKQLGNSPCNLCPRECQARRKDGQMGYCLSDNRIFVARAALHMWEEPCISGEKGSGTVFFSGCSLRCVYCQNYEIAAGKRGRQVSVTELAEIFLELQAKGAANINLVTPDHYIDQIASAVLAARDMGLTLPMVYNGSGYEKREVIKNLTGIVDVFLTDFKYMDEDLAEKYSKAPDYPSVAAAALEEMMQIAGEAAFDEKGMMQKGIIVRHLILPGHKKNAKAVVKYLYETYKDRIYLSLMNQYTPFAKVMEDSDHKELCRKVTKREYEAVVAYAIDLGVKNAFIQEGDTARESFVPQFDLNFHV